MNDSMKNTNAWQAVTPDITYIQASRLYHPDDNTERAKQYLAVAAQFDVENNPRYVRGHAGGRETYCNIFMCDVLLALGLPPSHWVDPATGVPAPVGKGIELNANACAKWFDDHGLAFEWMLCSEIQARKRATMGYPTVVVWANPGGIGHVAVVLPGTDFTHTAQAGADNFFNGNLRGGFGGVGPLKFWTHD